MIDENRVQIGFVKELDVLIPGVILMRSKHSKKDLPEQLGLCCIITEKLKKQNNLDVFRLVERQLISRLAEGCAKVYGSTHKDIFTSPLKFEYEDGEYDIGEGIFEKGTQVTVIVGLEELK